MIEPLNPGQLPQQDNAQFIAYGPEMRVADPQGGDEPLTVRSQTYVTYYRGIKIKAITEGGRSGDADVATVEFDQESVNLREPISAKVDPDDPILNYARQQHESGKPVDIAIEVIRKKKNADTRQPINVLTPIHALRGAQDASGTKAQTGPSFANTRKMLVMIDGRAGKALTSNPYEWASLVNNKAGNLPPEGWRFYAPGDDWSQYGAVVPSAAGAVRPPAGAPAAAPAQDLSAFLGEIEGLIHKVLDHREANPNVEVASGRPLRRRFDEGKQWDVRTNDGRINLGGYAVQSQAWTYRWAYDLLSADDTTPSTTDAWALADTVMVLGDRVQSEAYGHGATPDRTTASHKEAVRWVEWVITHHHPYPGAEGDLDTWAGEVAKAAIEHLAESGKRVSDWVQEHKNPKPQQPGAAADEPQGPSRAVVKALLGSIERTWDKSDALGNLAQEVTGRNLDDIEVGISPNENKTPTLTYPAGPNAAGTAPLGQLLTQRLGELSAEPVPEKQQEPQPAQDPAPQEEAQNPGPAEPQETPHPPAEQDPNRGYTPQVVEAIRAIHAATDLGTLRSAYDLAEERTVLQANVSARHLDNGRFEFGYNGQDGYPTPTIAQVIDTLREQFAAAQSPGDAPHEPTPNEAASVPEEQPEPDAAPEATVAGVAEPTPSETPAEATPVAQPETTHTDPETPAATTATVAQQITDSISPQTSTSAEVTAAIEKAQAEGVVEEAVTVGGRTGTLRAYLISARKRAEKAGR